jgi:hypothetical protein
LYVNRKNYRSTAAATNLWSNSENTGDEWRLGLISIPNNLTSTYILLVEGLIGGQNSGDIALDDFKIINGQLCPPPEDLCSFRCPEGTCVPKQKLCNFIADCAGGEDEIGCGYANVTFENDLSDWNDMSEQASSRWVRGNNGDGGNKGPLVDHSTGTSSGFFIYLDKNNGSETRAQFKSPIMRNSFTNCQIRFWYQINGRKKANL